MMDQLNPEFIYISKIGNKFYKQVLEISDILRKCRYFKMAELDGFFSKLPEKFIALAETSGINYYPTNLEILYHLVNIKKKSGIYVTFSRSYDSLKTLLEQYQIDVNGVYFIDAVTKTTSGGLERIHNCIFTNSPDNLTEVSIGVNELVKSNPKLSFLILDSISAILIYHQPDSVRKFAHSLTNMLRKLRMDGVIITLNREKDRDLITELKMFCDQVVNFD